MEEVKNEQSNEQSNDFISEDTLKFIAGVLMFFGIILAIVTFATTCLVFNSRGSSIDDFNALGLIPTFGYILGSLLVYNLLKVISDISTTLKKILKK